MSLFGILRKTLRKGKALVRRVGRATTRTVKVGTNAVGLTGKGKHRRSRSRRHRRRHH